MKGLLYKDLYILGKQMKFYLILILLFALLPGYSMTPFSIVYACMLPMTALAYDEQSKWGELAAMMPYSTRTIVLSKYCLGYICIAITLLFAIIAHTLRGDLGAAGIAALGMTACLGLTLLSIQLPLLFRLGTEKGRLLSVALIAAAALGAFTLIEGGASLPAGKWFFLVLPLLAVGLNLVSIALSTVLYSRRCR